MGGSIAKRCLAIGLGLIWVLNASAIGLKTLRVEHGRPVVVVSQKGVLVLEFVKETATETVEESQDTRLCRAKYRFKWFEGSTGAITNGAGTVHESYRVVSRSATGRMVENAGSQTGIGAGEFSISWSEANAGTKSWLYYRANSGIRFIQQPQRLSFDAMDAAQFPKYLTAKNVEEFAAAGQTVQVIGPAVFSGDMPDETPVAGRIEAARVKDGAFELKLSDLATNKTYVIESSYELKTGNWNVVHSFHTRDSHHAWSDPLGPEIKAAFYRIRQGP